MFLVTINNRPCLEELIMTTENNSENNQQQNQPPANGATFTQADIDKAVDAAIKDIKTKLDGAYAARDAALAEVETYKQKERDAEIQRLKDEGKHKEAAEQLVAEANAKREAAEKRNIELTRDVSVRTALSTLDFRNEQASNMAFNQIVSELVRNESGDWVHKSGTPIKDFITSYAGSEDNAFLFKPKANSGSGSQNNNSTEKPPKSETSLFKMKQEDVIKAVMEGKIGKK